MSTKCYSKTIVTNKGYAQQKRPVFSQDNENIQVHFI